MLNASNQMISVVIGISVAFVLTLSSQTANSQHLQACDYDELATLMNGGLAPMKLGEFSDTVQKAETSPFANACPDPELFLGRPKTGLFRRAVPTHDAKGRSTADFLKRVGVRVLASMKLEEMKFAVLEECLSKPPSSECKSIREWISLELRPMVKTSRMNLALAQTDGQLSTLSWQAKKDVNKSASALGTVKEVDWDPLTDDESLTAASILNEYITETKAEVVRRLSTGQLDRKNSRQFTNDALLAARYKNGLDYVETLARFPILQYLKSPSPSDTEVLSAVRRMRSNLASDRVFAERAVKAVPAVESLGLFEYGSFIESELQKTPEDCALAASLFYTKENRSTGEQLAIGVPLVVVAVALPIVGHVIAGTVVGVAGSVGYTINTKMNRDTVAKRFVSSLETETNEAYGKVERANHELKISVALMPLALGGGVATRAVAKYAYTGLQATRFGSKLAKKTAEKTSGTAK